MRPNGSQLFEGMEDENYESSDVVLINVVREQLEQISSLEE